jgi:hypothetical protein
MSSLKYIKNLLVTGTPSSHQIVSFEDLTDEPTGLDLDSKITPAPSIFDCGSNLGIDVYFPSVNEYFFEVARSSAGSPLGTLYTNIIIAISSVSAIVTTSLREMINMFGLLIGDPNGNKFKPQTVTWQLNRAQEDLMTLLNWWAFEELMSDTVTKTVDTNGDIDLSAFTIIPNDNTFGLILVRLKDGDICDLISYDEFKKYVDFSYSYSSSMPVYYKKGKKIHIEPYEASSTEVDIIYLEKPDTMVLASNPSADVSCCLDANKHDLVLGLACKNFIKRSKNAFFAYKNAIDKIDLWNSKKRQTDSLIRNKDRFYPDDLYSAEQSFGNFLIHLDS